MSIFVVLKRRKDYSPLKHYIMDILLQYLNVRKQKQEFVKVANVPCNSVYQSISQTFEINMADRALNFIDYMERNYSSNYMLVGIIDAKYCNRKVCAEFSYVDFRQLTCGPGETSGID